MREKRISDWYNLTSPTGAENVKILLEIEMQWMASKKARPCIGVNIDLDEE
jgi:hypothetical protein